MATEYSGIKQHLIIQKLACHNMDVSGKFNTSGPLSINNNLTVKGITELNNSTVVGTDANQGTTQFVVKGRTFLGASELHGITSLKLGVLYPPILSITTDVNLVDAFSDRPIYINNLIAPINIYLPLSISGMRYTFITGGNSIGDTLGYDVNIFGNSNQKIIGYINNSGGRTKIRAGQITMSSTLTTGDFISVNHLVTSDGVTDTACWFISGGGDSTDVTGFVAV
jgi:hypothetical protein